MRYRLYTLVNIVELSREIVEVLRVIHITDVTQVKAIADANRDTLGFMPRSKIEEVAEQQRAYVAIIDGQVIGFVIFRHRQRDTQTTLSDICIARQWRNTGVGRHLIRCLVDSSRQLSRSFIQLKCPVDLPSNNFYLHIGFHLHNTEAGKKRNLNVWRYDLTII